MISPRWAILDDVARDFGDGRGDQCHLRAFKPQRQGQRAALLTRRYNVPLGRDGHPAFHLASCGFL